MECRGTKSFEVHESHRTWMLGPLLNSVYLSYKLYICDLKCIYCMKNNDNDLVSSGFEYVYNNTNSIVGIKITYFR